MEEEWGKQNLLRIFTFYYFCTWRWCLRAKSRQFRVNR